MLGNLLDGGTEMENSHAKTCMQSGMVVEKIKFARVPGDEQFGEERTTKG
jgi:hypothetical protein